MKKSLKNALHAVGRVLFHDPSVVAVERKLIILLAIRIAVWAGAGAGVLELLQKVH